MNRVTASEQPAPLSEAQRTVSAAGAIVVVALLWGSMVPMTHHLANRFDPIFVACLRYLIALPAVWLLLQVLDGGRRMPMGLPWTRIALLGLVGMAGFSILFTIGFQHTDPVTVALIFAGGPLVAALTSKVMYRTKFERGLGLALLFAVGGGIVLALGSDKAGGFSFKGGELCFVAAQVCWNWYSMKIQEWLGPFRMSQLRMSFLTTLSGTAWLLLFFVLVLLFGLTSGPIEVPDQRSMIYFVIVGFGAGALSIWLWNVAVSRIGLPVAALYGNLTPVCAVGFAWAFGASVTWLQVFGGVLIIAGVVQMQLRKLWRPAAA